MVAGEIRGLLLDYGGVLTSSVGRSFREFEKAEGLPKGTIFDVVANAYRQGDVDHPLAALERGEIGGEDFERALRAELRAQGHELPPGQLRHRLFAGVRPVEEMWELVGRVGASVRTGLLSNSWGRAEYPDDRLTSHFDVVVVSGEVGLRKPDPAIYRLAADRLEVAPEACVFVDDLQRNVEAAEEVGMVGVHHREPAETARRLSELLDLDLTPSPGTADGRG